MNKGKYLGIDFGDRRVGIALSDFNKEIAFPRDILEYGCYSDLIRKIDIIVREDSVVKIILGLPIQMDGVLGERAEKTQHFGQELMKAFPEIPLDYFDERLTSVEAGRSLSEQGYKTHEHKGKKDAIAAQKILEAYLNSRRQ